jgi:hypothetical protein
MDVQTKVLSIIALLLQKSSLCSTPPKDQGMYVHACRDNGSIATVLQCKHSHVLQHLLLLSAPYGSVAHSTAKAYYTISAAQQAPTIGDAAVLGWMQLEGLALLLQGPGHPQAPSRCW